MIHSNIQYQALKRDWNRQMRRLLKLQAMLLKAGATPQNVEAEMRPYFAAAMGLKQELEEFERRRPAAGRAGRRKRPRH